MSKIICDICGTTYPETADCCPICGCSRDAAADFLGDELLAEEVMEDIHRQPEYFTQKKKKEIFDFDEVNSELVDVPLEDNNPYSEEEPVYEEKGKHNVLVVILLTVLIVALLAAAGFIFVRYFLPNMRGEDAQAQIPTTEAVETTAAPTTDPSIPCQMLILSSGTAELTKEGQMFLLHVQPTPEDTTDEILYESADESIATVTADGKITAVAEGETVIYITCGTIQHTCPVIVSFVEETVPPTEATVPAETEAAETVPGETVPGETAAEETTDSTEQTEAAGLKDVTLQLKQKEFSLGVYYEHQIILDCDLEQNEVQWRSEHPHIATVDENGWVKAVKDGVTSIIVTYGDQEVTCIVRCVW